MFQQWKESFIAFKEDRHPHTNMAKALNMLTHTAFWDFSKDGIFMNAVEVDEKNAQRHADNRLCHGSMLTWLNT
jgi:hypothetical protein